MSLHLNRPKWMLGLALVLSACAQPADTIPSTTSQSPYRVLVAEDPGPLHSAQRHSYCVRVQCAYTSADYRSSCIKACTDSWALERPPGAVVKPVKRAVAKPVVRVVTKPVVKVAPKAKRLYHFDSDHSGTGVIGKVHLPLGKRIFRATHDGRRNFIVYVTGPAADSGPEVAFDEIGAGHWVWKYQVQQAGNYTIDIKAADGAWTIDIE